MLRAKEKYRLGFKHKGVQYYPEDYSQEKLQRLYNGPLKDFIEEIEDPKIDEVKEEELFKDKLIKPKSKK